MAEVMTPRSLLRQIVSIVARERNLNPQDIIGPSHTRRLVEARTIVAKRLEARGHSDERIANMMHLSLPTVKIYLGRNQGREPTPPKYGNREYPQ
jgi:DNA-binding NarL/FixJ family response regulator